MTIKDYSGKIFILLLISFFLPAITSFVFGVNMVKTGVLSPDKVLKAVLMLAVLITLVSRHSMGIRRDVWKYLLPTVIIIVLFLAHDFDSLFTHAEGLRARKEIVRVVFFSLTFLLAAAVSFRTSDFRLLICCMAIVAFLAGIRSVEHSIEGTTLRKSMQVGEFIRAGVGLAPPNQLGAALNLTALASLAGFFIYRGIFYRAAFLVAALAAQAGRFATFSTGSALNIIAAIFVALILLYKYEKETFKWFLYLVLSVVIAGAIVIIVTGTSHLLFYRAMLSDEVVMKSSVYSRVNQYSGLWEIVKNRPWDFVFGVGIVEEPHALGIKKELHNTYLRPLVNAGIGGLISFMILCWLCIKNLFMSVTYGNADRDYRLICIFMFAAFVGWSVQAVTLPAYTSVLQWFYFIIAYSLAAYGADSYGRTPGDTVREAQKLAA